MPINVIGCDFEQDCVYSHICKKNMGEIYEGKFRCSEFRNIEMFLNELAEKYFENEKKK